MSGDNRGYIASLDIGTTTVRCLILNEKTETVGSAYDSVNLIYPQSGYVEINPDQLWNTTITVVQNAIKNANIGASEVRTLGISTQRATFTTWRKSTGAYFHNFITWKDLRTKSIVKEVNSLWSMTLLRWAAFLGHFVTRSKKLAIASKLQLLSNHVSVRLFWVLQHNKELIKAIAENDALFGTVETWLLYKFSNGNTFVTDISNASATGFYDPFTLDWSLVRKVLNIPEAILPSIVNNDYDFGSTHADIFGVSIPIGCVMSDQSSSLFGQCCFNENDIKVTLGTGGFLNVNTADKIETSDKGMYPLIGWRLKNELVYISEVPCNDCGSLIQWTLNSGLLDDAKKSTEIANSVPTNDGVYFIPAFSGLGPPINCEKAASGFIGIKPTTTKAHLVRAVLESIVFRITLCYNILREERSRHYRIISVDGGVSKNDFICQMLADMTDLNVERQRSSEMSILGVGFLAGLKIGMWKHKSELEDYKIIDKTFTPSTDADHTRKCANELKNWTKGARMFSSWYHEP